MLLLHKKIRKKLKVRNVKYTKRKEGTGRKGNLTEWLVEAFKRKWKKKEMEAEEKKRSFSTP